MSAVVPEDRIVLRLKGNPSNLYFWLPEIHARRAGIVAHPDPDRPWQMMLADGADPEAVVMLPNGVAFTTRDLTRLSHKSQDARGGWEIWSDDPGGFPPS